MTAREKAIELGAVSSSSGINWSWVYFATEEAANRFDEWCRANYRETRGVYDPDPSESNLWWGVRYR